MKLHEAIAKDKPFTRKYENADRDGYGLWEGNLWFKKFHNINNIPAVSADMDYIEEKFSKKYGPGCLCTKVYFHKLTKADLDAEDWVVRED
jgi:hypothetical protein